MLVHAHASTLVFLIRQEFTNLKRKKNLTVRIN